MGYLYKCVVSSVYRVCHKLIFRVRRCMGIFHLVLYVLDIFQVLLDVHNLKKTWKYTNFLSVFLFLVIFSLSNSFLQSSGLRCKSRSILLW